MKHSSGYWFKGKNHTVAGLNIFYRKLSFLIILVIIVFVPVFPVHGVSAPYPVFGYVFDSSGSPVANLSINITDIPTGAHGLTMTNADGKYTIDLSVFKDYSDGDLIEAAASVACGSYGSYSASAYGKVDTEEGSTEIDLSFNRSFSTLVGQIRIFNGSVPQDFQIHLADVNSGSNFSGSISVYSGNYSLPLCVLPDLRIGDVIEVQAYRGNFSYEGSFNFYDEEFVFRNLTLIDTVPPEIRSISPTCGMNVSLENDIAVYAIVSDDSSLSDVSLYYSIDEGYFLRNTMKSETDSHMDWNTDGRFDRGVFGTLIPAVNSRGNLSYYVSAEDNCSNIARVPENGTCTLNLVDTLPPDISVIPVSSMEAGIPEDIYARVTDDLTVDSVYISYSNASSNASGISYDYNETMESLGNSTFHRLIGGQKVGQFTYCISAFDGSNWNSTRRYNVSVIDSIPPKVHHNPINSMNAETPAAVVATITDISGVYNATLHYMGVNSSIFTNTSMSASGDNFTASIPAQTSTGYLSYFITCDDGKNAARFPILGNITVPVFDAGTPLINSVAPEPVDVGAVPYITADISDDIGVSSATLYYNLSGSSDIHEISMSLISGDAKNGMWAAHLPAQNSPVLIWYRIEATDGTNNITYPYASMQQVKITDLSPPDVVSARFPRTANISSPFSVSISVKDNYEVTSAAMVEVSENGTWFTRRPMALGYGSAANGTWNLSMAFDNTGMISFFFEVSDGNHTIRYPNTDFLSFEIVDNILPVVEDIAARPHSHSLPAVPGDRIVVEAYVTDNLGVKEAVLSYLNDGRAENASMVYEGSHVFFALSDTVSVPGDFLYSIFVSDGFNTVRSPSEGWATLRVMDCTPPVIIHNIPQYVEAGRPASISGWVLDDFNVSYLAANYRFVSDDGRTGQWINESVPMASPVVSDSGVSRNFSLRLPSFFRSGTIEFNMSASDGYNIVYSPAGFNFSIKVKDTTPPSAYLLPTGVVYAGNESMVYVVASDLSGINSVMLKTSGGRNYRAEYLGSDASGNGTYLFRITSDTDVRYRLLVTDRNYNTLESPDSGYYLLHFDSLPPSEPPAVEHEPLLVINTMSLLLFVIQALAIFLILLHRKLI